MMWSQLDAYLPHGHLLHLPKIPHHHHSSLTCSFCDQQHIVPMGSSGWGIKWQEYKHGHNPGPCKTTQNRNQVRLVV